MQLFLIALALISITGSIFYYFYALTNGVILIMLAIILIVIVLTLRRSGGFLLSGLSRIKQGMAGDSGIATERHMKPARAWWTRWLSSPSGWRNKNEQAAGAQRVFARGNPLAGPALFILFIFFLLPLAAAFYTLFTHQTTDALRSPWESVPPYFFLLYGTAVLLLVIRKGGWRRNCHRATYEASASSVPPKADCGWLNKNEQAAGSAASVRSGQCGDRTPEIIPLILLTFLTLSISLIIFPLGSGFDPFIHQATEKIIALTGTITPKPLYYIGQYTLVVFLSKILGISIVWIDKLLVPLLASLLLPWSIMSWWNKQEKGQSRKHGRLPEAERRGTPAGRDAMLNLQAKRPDGERVVPTKSGSENEGNCRGRLLPTISYLLLPFLLTPFTTTTPYALALLFLVVLIFSVQRLAYSVQLLLATATLLIHPLVGIPAFIFLIIKRVQGIGYRVQIFTYALCVVLIPAAFFFASQLSSQIHITFAPQNFWPWLSSLEWIGIYRENRFNAPFDLLYFYGFNIKNIFWFFVFTTLFLEGKKLLQQRGGDSGIVTERHMKPVRAWSPPWRGRSWLNKSEQAAGAQRTFARDNPLAGPPNVYFRTFLILLTSYILMSGFLSFNFLIGYEQADYAKRVLDIAQLFLIPFFLLGIHWWLSRIHRAAAILLITIGITASLFLSYPQKIDSYSVSHAFNTSQADIDAVRWIDVDANSEDYIVLANQAVSAAAIRELGFKKYYQLTTASGGVPLHSIKNSGGTTDNLSRSDRGSSTGSGQLTTSIFFYPIPTGSPLYKFYLKMVYENASAETMREAMQLVGVNRAYFVLNNYWTDFEKIRAKAVSQLTLIHSINDSILIFRVK